MRSIALPLAAVFAALVFFSCLNAGLAAEAPTQPLAVTNVTAPASANATATVEDHSLAGQGQTTKCPNDCSGFGTCKDDGTCVCDTDHTGSDCSIAVTACPFDCGAHGSCKEGVCVCEPGWTGFGCQIAPACSAKESYKRCPTGDCMPPAEQCPVIGACPAKSHRCPDGTCVRCIDDQNCGNFLCQPFNGCPVDVPIACPDGTCTHDVRNCTGYCPEGYVRCFNWECVGAGFMCPQPPWRMKPQAKVYRIKDEATGWLQVQSTGDVDYQAMNVGLLNITGGSLATTDDKPAILMVTSLADSEIGGILPSLDWDYNPYMWIFSPIINFTVSPNVKSPFTAPIKFRIRTVIPKIKAFTVETPEALCLAYVEPSNMTWVCTEQAIHRLSDGKGGFSNVVEVSVDRFAAYAIVKRPKYFDVMTVMGPGGMPQQILVRARSLALGGGVEAVGPAPGTVEGMMPGMEAGMPKEHLKLLFALMILLAVLGIGVVVGLVVHSRRTKSKDPAAQPKGFMSLEEKISQWEAYDEEAGKAAPGAAAGVGAGVGGAGVGAGAPSRAGPPGGAGAFASEGLEESFGPAATTPAPGGAGVSMKF